MTFTGQRVDMNHESRFKNGVGLTKKKQNISGVKRALYKSFAEYCDETRVNGPHYWQIGVTKGIGRLVWTIIPIVLLLTGLILILALWERYLSSPTRMTIGRPLSVAEVPFPAISICHPRTVVEYKAAEFVDRMWVGLALQRDSFNENHLFVAKYQRECPRLNS